ncbi:hypothetical protein R1sor_027330 [Riccia sorocarpa]|uniref:Uncharacterized protein n=1 Tax=Riccia sorocarpa TaxID=122646 RepID=A0ABD3GFL8_9MARC
MASRTEKAAISGSKRNSPEGASARDKICERIIHLELKNRFLEERLKVVEEEARSGRLRIDELRRELRECNEGRESDKKQVAQQSADLQEMFRLYEHAAKKWRSLLEEKKAARAAGTPWKNFPRNIFSGSVDLFRRAPPDVRSASSSSRIIVHHRSTRENSLTV